jgi:formate/nitrite transporter FocA (FNT family)
MGFLKWLVRTLGGIVIGTGSVFGLIGAVSLYVLGDTTTALLVAAPCGIGLLYVLYLGADRDRLTTVE